jgi:MFS family permease
VWSLIFSYALPAISPGPILTILALYLGQGLHMSQAEVNGVVWVPPLTWGIGYFFWGWAADKFAATNTRPIGMFLLLTVCSLTLGLATWTTSSTLAIALISFSTFIGGGFQMVALKVGSFAFPREQSAMMTGIASGSWSLVNYLLLNVMGAGVTIWGLRVLPGLGWLNAQRWGEIFWLIAVLPAVGVALWMALSARQAETASRT